MLPVGLAMLAGPAGATATALQEYVNEGAAGHLWNAYNQSADALGPDITGCPSPISYGPTVQDFVKSPAGDLMPWVNDDQGGHLWNAYDLSQLAGGGGPVGGDPSAVTSGATVDVFVHRRRAAGRSAGRRARCWPGTQRCSSALRGATWSNTPKVRAGGA